MGASAASQAETAAVSAGLAAAPTSLPFNGGGFEGLDGIGTGSFPPDVGLAVGPSHVVATVNGYLGIFQKNGTRLSVRPIQEVLGLSGVGLGDPNVLYDVMSDRFFFAALGVPSQIVVGVSTSSDPTASWRVWSFRRDGSYDFPQIGVSNDLFVVNIKFRSLTGRGAIELLVIDKSDLVAGAASPRKESREPPQYLSPAQMLTSSDVLYLVREETLWTLRGKPGALSLTSQSMPGAFLNNDAVPVRQPGGVELDMNGRRPQLMWRNGVLWAATTRPCDQPDDSRRRTCVHLDAVATSGTPTHVQSFDVGSTGSHYFFPALAIDSSGNIVVVAGRTSETEAASVVVFGRRASDPPNTAREPVLLRSGRGTYGCAGARNYWGDFFAAAPDPADPSTLWVAGEYANVAGGTCSQSFRQWGTYIAQFNWLGACRTASAPTTTAYLPNVTKTLGGPQGFQTPFIVQNTGKASTDLEVSFYGFSDGALLTCRKVTGLAPGASFAHVPNTDADLPDNTQMSVVVRSFGSTIVGVVNQHGGSVESDAYSAATRGATLVYLPNVVREFFGYHSPAIIQNLGSATAVVTAAFRSFDGTVPTKTFFRTIAPGQSRVIEPNSDDPSVGAPGLVGGKQYSVTLESSQPISVVLNTHNDGPGTAAPLFYSANGVSSGANTVYGGYAVKNANGGRVSTIVVQNLAGGAVTPTLTFTPIGGGPPQTFTSPNPVASGAAWAFDPRFANGVATSSAVPCAAQSPTCLANGEFSFSAQAGGTIAAMVNVIGPTSGMGYTANPTPASSYFLPNVLASYFGWNTPILIQSVSATNATLIWTPFTGGAVTTQTVTLLAGAAIRIDPRGVPGLLAGRQYAVTLATNGPVTALVMELHDSGGDNAMIYSGFAAE
jgi:hypothetical protein